MLFCGPGLKMKECDVEYFAEQRAELPERIVLYNVGRSSGMLIDDWLSEGEYEKESEGEYIEREMEHWLIRVGFTTFRTAKFLTEKLYNFLGQTTIV